MTTEKKDDWDSHWDDYATAASQNPAQLMRHELVARLLAEVTSAHGANVLDIGSGQGDLIRKLTSRLTHANFLGAEISKSGVAISTIKVPSARFLNADIFNPSPQLEEFTNWANSAVCSEVLEHVDDPVLFLRLSRRYLCDGARLVVTVPGGPMSAFDLAIGHRQHFTRKSISSILELSGYSVERVYLAGFPFFNLYRLIVISRGSKLVDDVRTGGQHSISYLAKLSMKFFGFLFKFNLLNSKFGWQVVAVARK